MSSLCKISGRLQQLHSLKHKNFNVLKYCLRPNVHAGTVNSTGFEPYFCCIADHLTVTRAAPNE